VNRYGSCLDSFRDDVHLQGPGHHHASLKNPAEPTKKIKTTGILFQIYGL
jgi:hypothetical protein